MELHWVELLAWNLLVFLLMSSWIGVPNKVSFPESDTHISCHLSAWTSARVQAGHRHEALHNCTRRINSQEIMDRQSQQNPAQLWQCRSSMVLLNFWGCCRLTANIIKNVPHKNDLIVAWTWQTGEQWQKYDLIKINDKNMYYYYNNYYYYNDYYYQSCIIIIRVVVVLTVMMTMMLMKINDDVL